MNVTIISIILVLHFHLLQFIEFFVVLLIVLFLIILVSIPLILFLLALINLNLDRFFLLNHVHLLAHHFSLLVVCWCLLPVADTLMIERAFDSTRLDGHHHIIVET